MFVTKVSSSGAAAYANHTSWGYEYMANKGNIRSIRISDQMAELIDQQVGSNFTEKWENLVTRCVWELPKKEEELAQIEKRILRKKQEMAEASSRYAKMINQIGPLEQKLYQLDYAIGRAIDEWPNYET